MTTRSAFTVPTTHCVNSVSGEGQNGLGGNVNLLKETRPWDRHELARLMKVLWHDDRPAWRVLPVKRYLLSGHEYLWTPGFNETHRTGEFVYRQ